MVCTYELGRLAEKLNVATSLAPTPSARESRRSTGLAIQVFMGLVFDYSLMAPTRPCPDSTVPERQKRKALIAPTMPACIAVVPPDVGQVNEPRQQAIGCQRGLPGGREELQRAARMLLQMELGPHQVHRTPCIKHQVGQKA